MLKLINTSSTLRELEMKRVLCVLLSMTFLGTLMFGCQEGQNPVSDIWSSQADTTATVSSATESDDKFVNGDMRIISSQNGLIATAYASTPNGCYEVFAHPSGEGNILFNDYATAKLIYLSNQPNSTHDDETDTSWLPSTQGGCYPVVGGDKLYLFKLNTPGFIDQLGEAGKGYIYQYNLNGTGKRTLAAIEDNENISGCGIAFDGKNLYYISEMIAEEGAVASISIIQLNVNTGEKTVVKDLPMTERHFIAGAAGGSLILKHIINPVKVSFEDAQADFSEMYANQIHRLTLCTPDGEEKDILQWKQDEISETIYRDNLVYWEAATGKIISKNIFTAQERVYVDSPLKDGDGKPYDFISMSSDGFDGHVLFEAGVMVNDPEYDEAYPELAQKFAIDLTTGELKELNLTENDPLTGDERNVSIYAEGEDVFFLHVSRKEYELVDYFEDGQLYTTNLIVNVPAIISKSDYWNNIPNFTLFEDYVYV